MPQDSTELRIVLVEEGAAGQAGVPSPTPGGATGVYPGASAAGAGGGTGAAGGATGQAARDVIAVTERTLAQEQAALARNLKAFEGAAGEVQRIAARLLVPGTERFAQQRNAQNQSPSLASQMLALMGGSYTAGNAPFNATPALASQMQAIAALSAGAARNSKQLLFHSQSQQFPFPTLPTQFYSPAGSPQAGAAPTLAQMTAQQFATTQVGNATRAQQQYQNYLATAAQAPQSAAKDDREFRSFLEELRRTAVALSGNKPFETLAESAHYGAAVLQTFGRAGKDTSLVLTALAETGRMFGSVVMAQIERARELAPFSGPLTSSLARSEVRSLLQDIKEANVTGPALSRLVEAQSNLEIALREFLAPYKVLLAEVSATWTQGFANLLNLFNKKEQDEIARWKQIEQLALLQEVVLKKLAADPNNEELQKANQYLQRMMKALEAATAKLADNFTAQMEMLEQQQGTPDWDPRREVADQRVNVPAFHNIPGF